MTVTVPNTAMLAVRIAAFGNFRMPVNVAASAQFRSGGEAYDSCCAPISPTA